MDFINFQGVKNISAILKRTQARARTQTHTQVVSLLSF